MFIYVHDITDLAAAEQAIGLGAAGIAVTLGYKHSAVAAETARDWLEQLPLPVMKIGAFQAEAYYDVEEMASFCHLDCIKIGWQDDLSHYSRYSGRILVDLPAGAPQKISEQDWAAVQQIANGLVYQVEATEALPVQWLAAAEKPVFLAGSRGQLEACQSVLAKQPLAVRKFFCGWYLSYEEWQKG